MASTKIPGKGPTIEMIDSAPEAPAPQQAAQEQETTMETEMQRRAAEMQRMVQEALNSAAATASAPAAQERKPVSEAAMAADEKAALEHISGQDRLRVRLPLINKNDPEVTVTINGARYTIKRGATVELPAAVVEVLEHAGML